jgi:hypothetical protein
MITSLEARAAAKKAQLARLAKKGTPEYPALYAAQPQQQRKAAANAVERKAFHDAKQAVNKIALMQANEAAEVFGDIEVT